MRSIFLRVNFCLTLSERPLIWVSRAAVALRFDCILLKKSNRLFEPNTNVNLRFIPAIVFSKQLFQWCRNNILPDLVHLVRWGRVHRQLWRLPSPLAPTSSRTSKVEAPIRLRRQCRWRQKDLSSRQSVCPKTEEKNNFMQELETGM